MDFKSNLSDAALRIYSRRAELNLSLQQLADSSGLSRSTIQRYETGAIKNIPLDKLDKLANALDVSVEWIMGMTAAGPQDPELMEYLDELKNRSEMRMLFKLAKNATREDVEQAVKIIEALKK